MVFAGVYITFLQLDEFDFDAYPASLSCLKPTKEHTA